MFSIISIFIVTTECTFSALRKLKMYIRNTISKSKLEGLALLLIYRDIEVSDKMILDKFTNSSKHRNLNLIINLFFFYYYYYYLLCILFNYYIFFVKTVT